MMEYNREWEYGTPVDCDCENNFIHIDCGCKPKEVCECENILLEISKLKSEDIVLQREIDAISGASISGVTEEEVDAKIASAKTEIEAEIPSLSGYATEAWVTDQGYITGVDLSDYALKSEIPVVPTSNTAFTNDAGYLTEHQSLSGYATEEYVNAQISSQTSDFVTGVELSSYTYDKATIDEKIAGGGIFDPTQYFNTAQTINLVESAVTRVEGEIPTVPTSNTAFTNDAGYITGVDLSNYATLDDIPDMENYALKSEIPSLSGYATEAFVSGFTYDKATIDEKVAGGGTFDPSQYYNKTATDELLAEKLDATAYTPADLTDYVTYEDMSDYVGDVYTKDEVNDLFVTKQYFQKNAVTYTEYNSTIYNLRQEIESLKAAISACCSTTGETYTRWITVPNEYTCSGTSQYAVEKEQTSTDNINWTDTGNTRRGGLIELYSASCGYVPPVTYKVTMRYTDGTEDKRECDGSDVLRALNASNSGNISGVTVGSCIYEIGNLCFHEYTGLTSVSLPNSVTKIDKLAFSSCRSLSSITIPTGVTYIGEQAFRYCTSLTEITIPSGVTDISYATFIQCNGLTGITFPNTLETIGADALFKCTSLSSITIPSSVTHIGERAFGDNTSLENVTVLATTPPVLDYQDIFFGDHNLTAIYVPASSVNAYKTAQYWDSYANLIEPIP